MRTIGRNTQGVRLIKLDEGDVVSSLAKLPEDELGDGLELRRPQPARTALPTSSRAQGSQHTALATPTLATPARLIQRATPTRMQKASRKASERTEEMCAELASEACATRALTFASQNHWLKHRCDAGHLG